eukprot:TRINITY_DN1577_c0_g4_i1.p1 TRINITY_DN1577_c0_g4~~TRINITY_DN1577_c0_g4_i1.p1  ORF type:complete len:307 (+),score=97.48 TRINITY_DN1577_c0_g4_i1:60-980(+)
MNKQPQPFSYFVQRPNAKPANFSGSTLIIPNNALGNVGQLAVDLLVNSFQLEQVGYLYEPSVLPIVGDSAFHFHSPHLSTSLEVFQDQARKLTLIQLRAPIVKNRKEQFVDRLYQWAAAEGVKEIFVLSSATSLLLPDPNLQVGASKKVFLQMNSEMEKTLPPPPLPLTESSWIPLSALISSIQKVLSHTQSQAFGPPLQQAPNLDVSTNHTKEEIFNGIIKKGSFPGKLLQRSEEDKNKKLPVGILVLFCFEGNNIFEGLVMADVLHSSFLAPLLPFKEGVKKFQFPQSWKFLLAETPTALYLFD